MSIPSNNGNAKAHAVDAPANNAAGIRTLLNNAATLAAVAAEEGGGGVTALDDDGVVSDDAHCKFFSRRRCCLDTAVPEVAVTAGFVVR